MKHEDITIAVNLALLLFSLSFVAIVIDQSFNLGHISLGRVPGGILGFLGFWVILNLVRITILLTEIRDRIKFIEVHERIK